MLAEKFRNNFCFQSKTQWVERQFFYYESWVQQPIFLQYSRCFFFFKWIELNNRKVLHWINSQIPKHCSLRNHYTLSKLPHPNTSSSPWGRRLPVFPRRHCYRYKARQGPRSAVRGGVPLCCSPPMRDAGDDWGDLERPLPVWSGSYGRGTATVIGLDVRDLRHEICSCHPEITLPSLGSDPDP